MRDLIANHADGLAFVFKMFNINEKVTPETVLLAYVKHKKKFSDAVEAIIAEEDQESFLGEGKLANLLDKVVTVVTTGKEIKEGFENKSEEKKTPSPEPPKKKEILGLAPSLFWGLATTLVLITIFLITKKRS